MDETAEKGRRSGRGRQALIAKPDKEREDAQEGCLGGRSRF
jgi:hypothetical protein